MAREITVGITADELKKKLAAGSYGGGYLFFGDEEYIKDIYRDRFRQLVRSSGMEELNFASLNFALGATFEQLKDEINTLPVMSEYRLVEVSGLNPLSLDKSDEKAFLDAVEQLPDGVILVVRVAAGEIVMDKKTSEKKIVKTLSERLTVVNFTKMPPAKLQKWLDSELKAVGAAMNGQTRQKLCDMTLSDMLVISDRLKVLSDYARSQGREEIIESDLSLFVESNRDYEFFLLSDAVFSGSGETAIDIIASLRNKGEEPVGLLAFLERELGSYQVAASGVSAQGALKAAGLPEWKLKKMLYRARGFGKSFFIKAQQLCLDCDRRMKSEGQDNFVLLETLSLQIAALVRRAGARR